METDRMREGGSLVTLLTVALLLVDVVRELADRRHCGCEGAAPTESRRKSAAVAQVSLLSGLLELHQQQATAGAGTETYAKSG